MKKVLENDNTITLYENKTQPFVINNTENKRIIPLVLTLNQFGSLAINTSQLLEKDNKQPYPWVCNLHDLENIIEINKYLNKTTLDFIKYLNWRIDNHIHSAGIPPGVIGEFFFVQLKSKKSIKSKQI